ncbi:hypothetical protein EB796_015201 [Bugula neritina]|uniref:Uncharacterized protein n=1 Tax=Bugula neritina TaxID=10212 RepID=A0A7J7JM26_BUGNE|nr:hypothetical protein EB796_015201 [Bugula neritina]
MLDCSKTQRDEEFKLRQAAKQLKSDNPGTNFRTRDMSIQVQTAQVKWKQMKRSTVEGCVYFRVHGQLISGLAHLFSASPSGSNQTFLDYIYTPATPASTQLQQRRISPCYQASHCINFLVIVTLIVSQHWCTSWVAHRCSAIFAIDGYDLQLLFLHFDGPFLGWHWFCLMSV